MAPRDDNYRLALTSAVTAATNSWRVQRGCAVGRERRGAVYHNHETARRVDVQRLTVDALTIERTVPADHPLISVPRRSRAGRNLRASCLLQPVFRNDRLPSIRAPSRMNWPKRPKSRSVTARQHTHPVRRRRRRSSTRRRAPSHTAARSSPRDSRRVFFPLLRPREPRRGWSPTSCTPTSSRRRFTRQVPHVAHGHVVPGLGRLAYMRATSEFVSA